ncbi:glycosyl transferase family 39 [Mycobacterium sp. DSM 3803]|nr:glycosyl transferase family 39 [Mycobacterium sp. DSM 3803]
MATAPHATTTILAVNDLTSGSRTLYTVGVGILVFVILLGAGARVAVAVLAGKKGDVVLWAVIGVAAAVLVGGSYAIYLSTKKTVDQSGITTGQFG